jgi:hypothetical protein
MTFTMKMFKLFTNKISFIMKDFLQNTTNNVKSELGFLKDCIECRGVMHEDTRSKILHKPFYENPITLVF